jgi:hypothetical protein
MLCVYNNISINLAILIFVIKKETCNIFKNRKPYVIILREILTNIDLV